jgi:nitroreductase
MTYWEAIIKRRSRRTYLGEPIEPEKLDQLNMLAKQYNQQGNLRIEFITDGSDAFNGLSKSYGLFKGVKTIIALAGNKTDVHLKEKLGFFGELLVLEATKMDFGTCWVGGTFDRNSKIIPVNEDESLEGVITIGKVPSETLKERVIHGLAAPKSKPVESFYTSDSPLPSWIEEGLKAVQKAPSAVNRQPVRFEFRSGILKATVDLKARFDLIDLGIAKAHFVLVTGCEFEWGNGGRIYSPKE